MAGGEPEQRGGGSSVFEPLVRGGSFNFQLPMGVSYLVFFVFFFVFNRNWFIFLTIDNRGKSFQSQRTKTFRAVAEDVHFGWCTIEMTISCIVKSVRKLRNLTD